MFSMYIYIYIFATFVIESTKLKALRKALTQQQQPVLELSASNTKQIRVASLFVSWEKFQTCHFALC